MEDRIADIKSLKHVLDLKVKKLDFDALSKRFNVFSSMENVKILNDYLIPKLNDFL